MAHRPRQQNTNINTSARTPIKYLFGLDLDDLTLHEHLDLGQPLLGLGQLLQLLSLLIVDVLWRVRVRRVPTGSSGCSKGEWGGAPLSRLRRA
jgi:hypothetical protein